MKNSNGCPRRAIFRSSSSRRIRIGSGVGAGTPTAGGPLAQQSLMAGGGGGADRRTAVGGTQQQSNATKQENSPMDSKDQLQLLSGGQQQAGNNNSTGSSNNNRQSHNSPSEFGGSSSGGFTYFSGEFLPSYPLLLNPIRAEGSAMEFLTPAPFGWRPVSCRAAIRSH